MKTYLFGAVYGVKTPGSLFYVYELFIYLPIYFLYMFYTNFTKCLTHYFIINTPFIVIIIFR